MPDANNTRMPSNGMPQQEEVFHALRLALEQLIRQQQTGNAPIHHQEEILARIDLMLRQVQMPAQQHIVQESQESIVRLKQENKDQDLIIGQLNERIHQLLQQRGKVEQDAQGMAQRTLQVMIDELDKCQSLLSGDYLLKIIGGLTAIQSSSEGVPPLQNLPQAANQIMTAFKALLKQLQSLSKKKQNQSQGQVITRITERQREELQELRRFAEKEMPGLDDVYLRDYIENIDELLKTAPSSVNESMVQET